MSSAQILVSIVSYRDPLTPQTFQSLYENASIPKNIYVGIVWQYDPSTDDFVHLKFNEFRGNIRQLFLNSRHAKGPLYARHLFTQLYPEIYKTKNSIFTHFLQIDSHTLFVPHWDQKILQQYQCCKSIKPILTSYPTDFNYTRIDRRVNAMCASHFKEGFLRLIGKRIPPQFEPKRSLFASAGFLFGPISVLELFTIGKLLPELFFGEEQLIAFLLFVNNYALFLPFEGVCAHCYDRSYRANFRENWNFERSNEEIRSRTIVKMLFNTVLSEEESEVYIANSKSFQKLLSYFPQDLKIKLQEFQNSVGIDFNAQTIDENAKYGGLDPQLLDKEKRCNEEKFDFIMQLVQKHYS